MTADASPTAHPLRVAIVTRNAGHGGVESVIALHQRAFGADVFVTDSLERSRTCPFTFRFIEAESGDRRKEALRSNLLAYDLIVYHWVPAWALEAIAAAGPPSIEVVHAIATAGSDKSIPAMIVTHAEFLAAFCRREFGRTAAVVPNAVETGRFRRAASGPCVGALTSYETCKGIDVFLRAWSRVQALFPGQRVRFYGSGSEQERYQGLIRELDLADVELLGPVRAPEDHLPEFRLFVQPSREEGMPIAILEALACDLPVLCSDLPGMVELNRLARERGFGEPLRLFRSEDVEDLARGLVDLLSSTPSPASREYVRRFHGASAHCAAYRRLFSEVVEARTEGGRKAALTSARAVPPQATDHGLARRVGDLAGQVDELRRELRSLRLELARQEELRRVLGARVSAQERIIAARDEGIAWLRGEIASLEARAGAGEAGEGDPAA